MQLNVFQEIGEPKYTLNDEISYLDYDDIAYVDNY